MNHVSIIIPTYNGIKWLPDCMESLKKQSFQDFDVVVIDNASTDGSRQWINENYPFVKVHTLKENYGFTGAVNYGIKCCNTEYILLLNNDTVCETDFVGELYRAISADEGLFSVSSKMVKVQDENIIDDAGDLFCVLGWTLQRGTREKANRYQKKCKVFSSCGGAAIYRKSVLEEIGTLDPRFFAYLEDMDLGFRAKVLGYENAFCPTAVVHHIGSASTGGSLYNDFKVRNSIRNSLYMIYKNMSDWQIVLNLPALTLGYFARFVLLRKKGFGKAFMNGLKDGFIGMSGCKRVSPRKRKFSRDMKIEMELIWNTIIILKHYLDLKRAR